MKKSVIQRQRPDIFESFDHFNEWLSGPGHWLSGARALTSRRLPGQWQTALPAE